METRDWILFAQSSGEDIPALIAESSSATISETASLIPYRWGAPKLLRIPNYSFSITPSFME